MESARKTLVSGIPTAKPFGVVWVDDYYGLLFEHIAPADTVGKVITTHMERFEEVTKMFTDLLRQIHSTRFRDLGGFSSIYEKWMDWVEGMQTFYTEEETRFLRKMLEGVPERDTMVHCDFHENNVLMLGDKLVLIDMADIGYGHPVFDLAGGAFRAHVSLIPGRKAHHGLSPGNMQLFWNTILRYYFETEDEKELNDIHEMCEAFGLLRSALFPMKHSQISTSLRQIHLDDARQNLFMRKDWALEQVGKLNQYFGDR